MVYQYMAFFFNLQTTSNHLHPLQVENCDSNSRLVVDEDDNDKFRVERVKVQQGMFCSVWHCRAMKLWPYAYQIEIGCETIYDTKIRIRN